MDYVLGLARNERLREMMDEGLAEAAERQQRTGAPAQVLAEFDYQTRQSWSRARRVVAQAEQLEGQENRRYLVTSLDADRWPARPLDEQPLRRARGDGEAHQGAVELVQRSQEPRDAAGQPTGAVFVGAGLGVAGGAAAAGARGHGVGAGTDGDDAPRVVEDRRAAEAQRAPGVAVAGWRLPLGGGVRGPVSGPASAGISVSSGDGGNPSPSGEEKVVVVWSRAEVPTRRAHKVRSEGALGVDTEVSKKSIARAIGDSCARPDPTDRDRARAAHHFGQSGTRPRPRIFVVSPASGYQHDRTVVERGQLTSASSGVSPPAEAVLGPTFLGTGVPGGQLRRPHG